MANVTEQEARKEYEDHAALVSEQGVKLPTWEELDDFDRAMWEAWYFGIINEWDQVKAKTQEAKNLKEKQR